MSSKTRHPESRSVKNKGVSRDIASGALFARDAGHLALPISRSLRSDGIARQPSLAQFCKSRMQRGERILAPHREIRARSWRPACRGHHWFRSSRMTGLYAPSMRRLMRSLGFTVETFPSAAGLLASPHLAETDCLIAGCQYAGHDGNRTLSTPDEGRAHPIPTILITAYPNDLDRTTALNEGVICYLPKAR